MGNLDLSVMGSNNPLNHPKTTDLTFDNGDLVRVDEHGRWNLNDIHKHSGVGGKQVSDFTRLKSTQEYLEDLETDGEFPYCILQAVNGGNDRGTYAHEELALEYARWISVKLRREVNQVFIKYQNGTLQQPEPQFNNPLKQAMYSLLASVDEHGNDIDHLHRKADWLHHTKADKTQVDGIGRQLTLIHQESRAQTRRNEVVDSEIEERITREEADNRYVRASSEIPDGFFNISKYCDDFFLTRNDDGRRIKGSKYHINTKKLAEIFNFRGVRTENTINRYGKEMVLYYIDDVLPLMREIVDGMVFDRTTKQTGNKIFINKEADIEVSLTPDCNGGVSLTYSTASPLDGWFNGSM